MSYLSFWHVPSIYWYVSYISNLLKLIFWLSYSVKSLDMHECASHYPNSPHFILPHGLPWWLSGKESACQCRRRGFNPWPGRSPGGGNGNLLQYFCLENPMDRGAWQVAVHGITKSQTWLRRSMNPGSGEMTYFPNVDIPMLTTVICLIDQSLVYIFGVFIDTKTYSKLWLENTDLEVFFFWRIARFQNNNVVILLLKVLLVFFTIIVQNETLS